MKKNNSMTDYVSCFEDRELYKGTLEKALVIILRTGGCTWSQKGGCFMCGYRQDAYSKDVPADAIMKQFDSAMQKFDGHKIVKVFNSGSFLNKKEIPEEARNKILQTLSEKNVKIVFETRPEYLSGTNLDEIKSISGNLEAAIGLESAVDLVNDYCINKGSSFDDYAKASELLRKHEIGLRTYLLLKPPFLTESESIEDVWESMERIKNMTDIISINPVNIQKGTVVEKMWKRGQYRPPWLWSLLEVLKRVRSWRDMEEPPLVISHPSGAGTFRGINNCPKCNTRKIQAVKQFSESQSYDVVKDALDNKCTCFEEWQDIIELEPFSFTSAGRINYRF